MCVGSCAYYPGSTLIEQANDHFGIRVTEVLLKESLVDNRNPALRP
jgi:hypothetical protein